MPAHLAVGLAQAPLAVWLVPGLPLRHQDLARSRCMKKPNTGQAVLTRAVTQA